MSATSGSSSGPLYRVLAVAVALSIRRDYLADMRDPNDDGPEPRYSWRETWAGEGHQDYAAWDGPRQFGRIFYEDAGPTKGLWRWAISHIDGVKRPLPDHHGYAKSARHAAAKVEDHYERLAEHNGLAFSGGRRPAD